MKHWHSAQPSLETFQLSRRGTGLGSGHAHRPKLALKAGAQAEQAHAVEPEVDEAWRGEGEPAHPGPREEREPMRACSSERKADGGRSTPAWTNMEVRRRSYSPESRTRDAGTVGVYQTASPLHVNLRHGAKQPQVRALGTMKTWEHYRCWRWRGGGASQPAVTQPPKQQIWLGHCCHW